MPLVYPHETDEDAFPRHHLTSAANSREQFVLFPAACPVAHPVAHLEIHLLARSGGRFAVPGLTAQTDRKNSSSLSELAP